MPKIKLKRASSTVDMTAMCDVAFLLLTFFILTAQFRSQDAAAIETPSSISSIKVPDTNIMTIALDKEGKIYFGIDGQPNRIEMLEYVGEAKGVTFSAEEKKKFALMSNFGLPIGQLKSYLSLSKEQQAKVKQPGIPTDTTGAGVTNELKDWVYNSRKANNDLRIALKGDNLAKFSSFKDVLATLQAQNINKFNLITGTEAPPAGWKADK